MGGRVTGHLLKHPDRDDDGTAKIGTGPTTVQVTLEDDLGRRCKAELVLDAAAAARAFPIGGYVRVELSIAQTEMQLEPAASQ
jgi:hypothetical protein